MAVQCHGPSFPGLDGMLGHTQLLAILVQNFEHLLLHPHNHPHRLLAVKYRKVHVHVALLDVTDSNQHFSHIHIHVTVNTSTKSIFCNICWASLHRPHPQACLSMELSRYNTDLQTLHLMHTLYCEHHTKSHSSSCALLNKSGCHWPEEKCIFMSVEQSELDRE